MKRIIFAVALAALSLGLNAQELTNVNGFGGRRAPVVFLRSLIPQSLSVSQLTMQP